MKKRAYGCYCCYDGIIIIRCMYWRQPSNNLSSFVPHFTRASGTSGYIGLTSLITSESINGLVLSLSVNSTSLQPGQELTVTCR